MAQLSASAVRALSGGVGPCTWMRRANLGEIVSVVTALTFYERLSSATNHCSNELYV
jgi:hypothetical protein